MILKDGEYRETQRIARLRHMSITKWVRQALDLALRGEPLSDRRNRLEVVRAAARGDYPSGDLDRMLQQIDSGYEDAQR